MTHSLISIITPVYNRENIVVETIESVIAQNSTNWEHIIVDDGSTDQTWDVLQKYSRMDNRIKILKRERKPKGAQTCRNIGIETAMGEYLVFLDSDDLLKPFCMTQRMDFIKSVDNFDLAVFSKEKNKVYNRSELLINFLRYRVFLQTTDLLWSKRFLRKIGGWNEKLLRFQDIELIIRGLLFEEVNLVFSSDHKADSVFRYKREISEGNDKFVVFNGLTNFIIEVTHFLELQKKETLRNNLRSYLCSWMIHYHSKDVKALSMELIDLFKKQEVVSSLLAWLIKLNLIFIDFRIFKLKKIRKLIFYTIFNFK